MADEENAAAPGAISDDEGGALECPKCEECVPGLPGWMATFSDLVTLLLTFFVLLLSFAKTETAKYEAAMGSIRKAFGGNVLQYGEVIQTGKSPDNSAKVFESQQSVRPFPIDFHTTEGLLDKHEVNRESEENLMEMKGLLSEYALSTSVDMERLPEGIKVRLKNNILFKSGKVEISDVSVKIFERLVKLLANENWTIFVEGHASVGEEVYNGLGDALVLSSQRSMGVMKMLIRMGVLPEKITPVFYGDTRPLEHVNVQDPAERDRLNRRVEFLIRKRDLKTKGYPVYAE